MLQDEKLSSVRTQIRMRPSFQTGVWTMRDGHKCALLDEAEHERKPAQRCGRISLLANVSMAFVSFTFSIWNVLAKKTLGDGADPIIFSFIRDVGSAIVLITTCGCSVGLPRPESRADALQFLVCGVSGIWGVQLFYTLGLWKSDAEKTAVFQLLTPILVAIMAAVIGLEKYTFSPNKGQRWDDWAVRRSYLKVLGIILGLVGLGVLIGPAGLRASFSGGVSAEGDLFLFLSDSFGAVWALALKPLFKRYHPLVVAAYNYAIGAVGMILTVIILRHNSDAWHITRTEALVLIYAVLICSSFNYAIMTWCNQHLEGTLFALYGGLQPVFTAILAWVFLNEKPTWVSQ